MDRSRPELVNNGNGVLSHSESFRGISTIGAIEKKRTLYDVSAQLVDDRQTSGTAEMIH